MQYQIVQAIDSMNNGAYVTAALSPTATAYKLSDGSALTPIGTYVTITQIAGTGFYRVAYDPVANGNAVVLVYLGATVGTSTLVGDLYREVEFRVTPETTKTELALPAAASGKAGGLAKHSFAPLGIRVTGSGAINGETIAGLYIASTTIFNSGAPVFISFFGSPIVIWLDGLNWRLTLAVGNVNGWKCSDYWPEMVTTTNMSTAWTISGTGASGSLDTLLWIEYPATDGQGRTIQAAATAALNAYAPATPANVLTQATAALGTVIGTVDAASVAGLVSSTPKRTWDYLTSAATVAGSIGKLVDGMVEDIDTELSNSHGAGSWGIAPPASVEKTVTVQNTNGTKVAGAEVTTTQDAAGLIGLAGPFITNSQGVATCYLPIGAQYLRAFKVGESFPAPVLITVS